MNNMLDVLTRPFLTFLLVCNVSLGCATTIDSIPTDPVETSDNSAIETVPKVKTPNPLLERPRSSKLDMDRWAILQHVGEFKVTFDFLETLALRTDYELKKPYHAEARETVIVIEDSERRISLQHILKVPGMGIIKHWRQDWIYEPENIYEFRGNNHWVPIAVSSDEASGAWAQVVYQVDDSPRYAGVGKWVHDGNLSHWEADAARPLPRREYTKRSDYQILMARNRVTLIPSGWIHEQDNYKKAIGDHPEPIIAREVGFNVYKRIEGVDFSDAYNYWEQTKVFWAAVREFWDTWKDGENSITLKKKWDGKRLWRRLFELAEESKKGEKELAASITEMKQVHRNFLEELASKETETPAPVQGAQTY